MSLTFNILISISYERVLEAVTFIENYLTDRKIIFKPTTGIICGTDLGLFIIHINIVATNYQYNCQAS